MDGYNIIDFGIPFGRLFGVFSVLVDDEVVRLLGGSSVQNKTTNQVSE